MVRSTLPTCLCEFSHLTGTVVGQARNRAQRRVPTTSTPLAHVTNEGVQKRVGRLPVVGEGHRKAKDRHFKRVIVF